MITEKLIRYLAALFLVFGSSIVLIISNGGEHTLYDLSTGFSFMGIGALLIIADSLNNIATAIREKKDEV